MCESSALICVKLRIASGVSILLRLLFVGRAWLYCLGWPASGKTVMVHQLSSTVCRCATHWFAHCCGKSTANTSWTLIYCNEAMRRAMRIANIAILGMNRDKKSSQNVPGAVGFSNQSLRDNPEMIGRKGRVTTRVNMDSFLLSGLCMQSHI